MKHLILVWWGGEWRAPVTLLFDSSMAAAECAMDNWPTRPWAVVEVALPPPPARVAL